MDLRLSAAEREFRDRVRRTLADNLPAEIAAKVEGGKRLDKQDFVTWQKILHRLGSTVPLSPDGSSG